MAATPASTELEAVNEILRGSRLQPVSALGSSEPEAETAEAILDQINRQVQGDGWFFNQRQVTLEVVGGVIPVDADFMSIEAPHYPNRYTVRGGNLYDLKENTDAFTKDVCVNVVELLEWGDIPQPARDYITAKAARVFADRMVTDPTLARLLARDEAETYQRLVKHSTRAGNYRIWDSGSSNIVDRGSPIFHY